ncbi:hypothetical protein NBH00_12745 [Paraconexibacter antarcticus]|uniref:Uncharacterized protein n=1 Tax=Paraconexibacter antarcticus TaxID=2949664 RepID=A0ABY5DN37_9ACTN|nr:hypothetical protein [Paraconexibacter antarcticus]UTI62236.1 hypothetical protein NBH00_12745 [Paraconexibacter antarcticus]
MSEITDAGRTRLTAARRRWAERVARGDVTCSVCAEVIGADAAWKLVCDAPTLRYVPAHERCSPVPPTQRSNPTSRVWH